MTFFGTLDRILEEAFVPKGIGIMAVSSTLSISKQESFLFQLCVTAISHPLIFTLDKFAHLWQWILEFLADLTFDGQLKIASFATERVSTVYYLGIWIKELLITQANFKVISSKK